MVLSDKLRRARYTCDEASEPPSPNHMNTAKPSGSSVAGGGPIPIVTGPQPAVPAADSTLAPAVCTFVALSKFVIANDKTAEVKAAFRQRPHLVDDQPGFVRMEVLSPLDRPEELWLVTFWTDAESFELWHHSHLYHESHKGIPKGLKLVPGAQEIRHFEHVSS